MPRAPRVGSLPADGVSSLGGVPLPPGRVVRADPQFVSEKTPITDLLWASVDRVADVGALAAPLAAQFADTGLWPLALESFRSDDARPWFSGELDPGDSTSADLHTARAVLAAWWENALPDEDDTDEEGLAWLAPYQRAFPGLAPGIGTNAGDVVPFPALELSGRLALVAVTRPADVVAAVGWTGPINHFTDMGMLAAVLRDWEDRFGAYVVAVGFDTLTLAVHRPPSTKEEALAVAAEHFAACSDSIFQGAGSIDEYAESLVGARTWRFWWD